MSVSTDFVHWTPPAMSIQARDGEQGNTVYNHVGFVYGDRYLGFMFARGETPGAVEASLRQAHARLRVVVDD